jgi:chromosome partitioning protein
MADTTKPSTAPRAPHPARIIAFMNQKGGVGKTTTAVNLAAGIARQGKRTLLIDLDPQAHASLHLGVEPGADGATVYDALHDPSRAASAIVHARENLDVLPAETDLAAAESELANAADRQQRLADAIAGLQSDPSTAYDFILMDCPPSLGLLTLNGLTAAREVMIPMQAHFLALQGVGKLLETVRLVAQQLNNKLRISGVILCMHEEVTRHAKEVVADLDSFFEQAREQDVPWRFARVYRPPIRRNIKLAESPSFGQTIYEYAPGAPGAQDYDELAQRIVSEWNAYLAKRAAPAANPEVVVRPHAASGAATA